MSGKPEKRIVSGSPTIHSWLSGRGTDSVPASYTADMRTSVLLSIGFAIAFSVSLPLCTQAQDATPAQLGSEKGTEGPKAVDSAYRKLDGLVSHLRARNAEQFATNPAKGIDEASFIPIGGIEQWVTIRGQDRANPVLLFLHGGPGDVTNPWAFALFALWEEHSTVAQWDQRGAGRTFRRNGPPAASTMTLDRMAQDGVELAQ